MDEHEESNAQSELLHCMFFRTEKDKLAATAKAMQLGHEVLDGHPNPKQERHSLRASAQRMKMPLGLFLKLPRLYIRGFADRRAAQKFAEGLIASGITLRARPTDNPEVE